MTITRSAALASLLFLWACGSTRVEPRDATETSAAPTATSDSAGEQKEGGDRGGASGAGEESGGGATATVEADEPAAVLATDWTAERWPEIAEMEALVKRGELDRAQEILTTLVEPGLDPLVEGLSEERADAVRDRLDALAKSLGEVQIQRDVLEATHAARERLLPPEHPDLIEAKRGLALVRFELDDLAGTLELEEDVLAALAQQLPPDHPELLEAKQDLAWTRGLLGDLEGMRELEEDVHAARERLLPPDDPDLLTAKQDLAVTRFQLGDLAGALELDESVHAALARQLPPDHRDLLSAKKSLATTRNALGDLAGAHELLEYVHAARERLLPPDHPDLLEAKQDLAVTRFQLGDLAGALELDESVHAALARQLPPDHRDLLSAKKNLATTRNALDDLAGAHELLEYVHAARERLLPPDHPDLLSAKLNLAATRERLGDLAGALELEESVHEARERLLPPDHPDLLAAKLDLAATLEALGDLVGALEIDEYVHAARERLLPPDHPDLLAAKQNLASTRHALGDLAGALELEESVHATWERLLPPDHPDLLSAKLDLAVTRYALGDLTGAHALRESVHAAWEQLLPPDHPDLLGAKQDLAATRYALGDLAGAHELDESVYAARQRLLPPEHSDLLDAKENLAITRWVLGDVEGAHELLESVHAARERLLPPGHPDLLSAKLNLAVTRGALGDLAGRHELDASVHAARERLLPLDHPDLLAAKQNLALTRGALGDLAGRHELEKYVYAAQERLLPPDHPDLLTAMQNLALTRGDLGDIAGAHALQESVHAARERLLPPDHPDLLRSKQNLARTRYALGDLVGLRAICGSLLQAQVHVANSLDVQSPRLARSAALRELDRFPQTLFWSRSLEAGGETVLDVELFAALESLRQASTSFADMARAAASDPELDALMARLTRIRGDLAGLSQATPSSEADVEAWRRSLYELAEQRDGLQRAVRVALAERGVASEMPSVAAVARGLAPDAALVSYYRYRRFFEADAATDDGPPAIDSLLAFVVTPDATVQRIELGAVGELEDLASQWRAALGKPIERGLEVVESGEDPEIDLGTRLRERLLDPCLRACGERAPTTVHLVLDDFLFLVPVDALPWTTDEHVGDAFDVVVETTVRRLMKGTSVEEASGTLLALGGVDFKAEGLVAPRLAAASAPVAANGGRSGASTAFNPLIQSRYEAEAAGGLYEELVGGEPLVRTRREASKATLVELAAQARYLHVATHGWFAPESAAVSMLDGVGKQADEALRLSVDRAQDMITGFLPETLCGLALAGANHGAAGILTAEELSTLDLTNCELAVLSACETNVGIRRAGQGIQSLQSALHAAGARTAITSLWKVDDAATRRLFELFYTALWQDGLGKADALWRAKMALREEGHPVRDWAGWVLTGDPN